MLDSISEGCVTGSISSVYLAITLWGIANEFLFTLFFYSANSLLQFAMSLVSDK